jgi:amidase
MTLSNGELCSATASELSAALDVGGTTSVDILTALVERVALIDAPGTDIELRSILALAPDALDAAQRADNERANGNLRSRLHGIPILVKDNIEAVGLPGTAGSTTLLGRPVVHDSPLAARIRNAGLIIFGATNLSQWANLRSPTNLTAAREDRRPGRGLRWRLDSRHSQLELRRTDQLRVPHHSMA